MPDMLIEDEEEREVFQDATQVDEDDFAASFANFQNTKKEERGNSVESSMYQATQKDPDQHAKTVKAAERAGVPVLAAETDPQTTEQQGKLKERDWREIADEHHETAKLLGDPDKAAVIQDDIDTYLDLETIWTEGTDKLIRAPAAGAIQTIGNMPTAAGELIDEATLLSTKLIDAVLPESMDKYIWNQEDTPDIIKDITELNDRYGIVGTLKGSGAAVKQFAEVVDVPQERKDWMTDITGAMGQIAGMVLVSNYGGAIAGTASMMSQGVVMQNDAIEESGNKPQFFGVETKLPNLLLGGAITAATERWGIDKLFNRLPKEYKNKFVGLTLDVFKAGGLEAVEEFTEGIAHSTLEYFTFNEDVDFTQGIIEEMRAAAGAAGAFRLLLQVFTPRRAKLNLKDYSGEQTRLDEMLKTLEDSVSKDRDPNQVREHIQNLIEKTGRDGEVFIPAQDTEGMFDDLSLDQSIPEVQAVLEQIPEALRLGGDIVIPTEDFMAHFSDTETITKLRDHLRLSSDTFTRSEANELDTEYKEEVLAAMEIALEFEKTKEEAKEIGDLVYADLVKTGKMNSKEARMNAKLMQARIVTKSEELGVTPTELWSRLGVEVTTGEVFTGTGVSMQQDFGDVRIKDEKILSSTGKKQSIDAPAQKVWETNVKRRNQAQRLKDCMNG